MLRHSERLTDPGAGGQCLGSAGQQHLLAISQRRSLHQDVTDVLCGDAATSDVDAPVARNPGARFSDSGFWHLVQRSENDIVLALEVGARRDIPRHHFQRLVARASDEVKARLTAIRPDAASVVSDAVTEVTGQIQAKLGPATRSYFAAKRLVGDMHRSGRADPGRHPRVRKDPPVRRGDGGAVARLRRAGGRGGARAARRAAPDGADPRQGGGPLLDRRRARFCCCAPASAASRRTIWRRRSRISSC